MRVSMDPRFSNCSGSRCYTKNRKEVTEAPPNWVAGHSCICIPISLYGWTNTHMCIHISMPGPILAAFTSTYINVSVNIISISISIAICISLYQHIHITKSYQYLSLCSYPYQYLYVYIIYLYHVYLSLHLHGRPHPYLHHTYPDICIHKCGPLTNLVFIKPMAKERDTNFSLTTGPLRVLVFLFISI